MRKKNLLWQGVIIDAKGEKERNNSREMRLKKR